MKREKIQQLGHLLAGIIILVFGFDSFEAGKFASAAYYLSFAIMFLIVAGGHKWIVQKFMGADVALFLVEAIAFLYIGWNYKSKGHPFLYYFLAAAGCLYLVFAVIALFQSEQPRHRNSRRKKRRRSSLDPFKTTRTEANREPE